MTVQRREYPLEPGWFFWIAPGTMFSARRAPATRPDLSVVHFAFENDTSSPPRGAWHVAYQPGCAWVVEHIMVMVQDAIDAESSGRRPFPPPEPLLITLLSTVIDTMAPQPRHAKERRVERVCRAIDANPAERATVAQLAGLAGLSERYFTTLFRRYAGMSPKAYQLRSRLRYAYGLLAEQGLSVKECAAALGYTEPSVFSRQFSERYHKPPSAVRA